MTDEDGDKVWPVDGDTMTDANVIKVYEPFGPTDASTGTWGTCRFRIHWQGDGPAGIQRKPPRS